MSERQGCLFCPSRLNIPCTVTQVRLSGQGAMQAYMPRPRSCSSSAQEGKPENRFRAVDLYPVVIAQNFKDEPGKEATARASLINYAQRLGGGQAMFTFCFDNFDKLEKLISRCWEIQNIPEYLEYHSKSNA